MTGTPDENSVLEEEEAVSPPGEEGGKKKDVLFQRSNQGREGRPFATKRTSIVCFLAKGPAFMRVAKGRGDISKPAQE